MSRPLRVLVPTLAIAVVLGVVALAAPTTAATRAAATQVAARTTTPWSPRSGPVFNDANGTWPERNRIARKIIRSIDGSKKGSTIRIATWSFFTRPALHALIRAHQRGVSVRLVMASGRAKQSPNYWTLKRALKKGNRKRPPAMRSGARTCRATCRGTHGTLHSKLFLFSKVGHARDITMWGSPNLTSSAVRIQWNDLYTEANRKGLFDYASKIYRQLWRDQPVKDGYRVKNFGRVGFSALPYHGTSDWITKQLRKVRCSGAKGWGTVNGHTRIKIAQAVIRGTLGNRISRHLKSLYDSGCEVTILYSVRGRSVAKILESHSGRGAIPMRHFVQDTNGDGLYDKYLHMKVLAISGHIGSDPSAKLVMNGSENWANMSYHNDEIVGYFHNKSYRQYSRWLTYLWRHVPVSVPPTYYARTRPPTNPYANLELD
ncbi:phospholipase D family protein [Nocardioides terrisoli]|uniref:phospholipase D family protein n=1 Tax=Nocardioides terrisoli TaxID=3388267 RepID=UPI00287BB5FF|nr:phospholipase D family protein [Nocardioides marmorisolisilvae]